MIEATSCGGVVIYRGKILALYKSYKNRYEGWVLPKGTVEPGETHIDRLPYGRYMKKQDVRAHRRKIYRQKPRIILQYLKILLQKKYTGI